MYPGGNYVQGFNDKEGNRIYGAKSYRLRVPAKAPAAAFWSLTLYDASTRSIQNAVNDSAARPLARSIRTSAPNHRRVWRETGSRRLRARASILCSVSILPRRRCSTAPEAAGRRTGQVREDRHELTSNTRM